MCLAATRLLLASATSFKETSTWKRRSIHVLLVSCRSFPKTTASKWHSTRDCFHPHAHPPLRRIFQLRIAHPHPFSPHRHPPHHTTSTIFSLVQFPTSHTNTNPSTRRAVDLASVDIEKKNKIKNPRKMESTVHTFSISTKTRWAATNKVIFAREHATDTRNSVTHVAYDQTLVTHWRFAVETHTFLLLSLFVFAQTTSTAITFRRAALWCVAILASWFVIDASHLATFSTLALLDTLDTHNTFVFAIAEMTTFSTALFVALDTRQGAILPAENTFALHTPVCVLFVLCAFHAEVVETLAAGLIAALFAVWVVAHPTDFLVAQPTSVLHVLVWWVGMEG
jgi:hypothetical protein